MFGHLVSWLINNDRKHDVARHNRTAELVSTFKDRTAEAPQTPEQSAMVTEVKVWVAQNLSTRAHVVFDDAKIVILHLKDSHHAVAGAMDVSVDNLDPRRSWFVAEVTEDAKIIFAEILDVDPLPQ